MRIDEFLGFDLSQKVYPDFRYVCKFLLTLNHGQRAAERGFNIIDNLKDATLTSLRSVHDEIIHYGSIRSFPIDNSLLLSCNSASNRYKNDLVQRREESVNSENNPKR